jgi:hypothetical protein
MLTTAGAIFSTTVTTGVRRELWGDCATAASVAEAAAPARKKVNETVDNALRILILP